MNTYPEKASDPADFIGLLSQFDPIRIEEMDSIKLMNRIDSKYLTDTLVLHEILRDALAGGYRIFENCGKRLLGYDSIYFDTEDVRMFTEHRRGKATREKVRTRSYTDSGQFFLEVKRKDNHKRTRKKRISVPVEDFSDFSKDPETCEWLDSHSDYSAEVLSPSLESTFKRITLVNKNLSERITIDTSVAFRNLRTKTLAELGAAVVIELKQDGRVGSQMKDILLKHRVKSIRISKYCIGIVSTDSNAHPGRFKSKLRAIEKLNKQFYFKCYRPIILQPL